MTTPLLSPGGKRKAEKEERDRPTLAQAVKKAEDKRKARRPARKKRERRKGTQGTRETSKDGGSRRSP